MYLRLKLKALLQSFCPADQLRVVTTDAIIWPDKRLYIIIPFCHNTRQCTGRRRLVNHLTALVVSGCQVEVVKTCLLPLLVANKTEKPFGTGIVHLTKFFFVAKINCSLCSSLVPLSNPDLFHQVEILLPVHTSGAHLFCQAPLLCCRKVE